MSNYLLSVPKIEDKRYDKFYPEMYSAKSLAIYLASQFDASVSIEIKGYENIFPDRQQKVVEKRGGSNSAATACLARVYG